MRGSHEKACSYSFDALCDALGTGMLNAQSKPPIYVVAEVDVSDSAGFVKEYLPKAQASIKSNGGRFLVAGQSIKALEGTPPRRVIVTAWDSVEQVDEWFNSPAFKELRSIGDRYAKFRPLMRSKDFR